VRLFPMHERLRKQPRKSHRQLLRNPAEPATHLLDGVIEVAVMPDESVFASVDARRVTIRRCDHVSVPGHQAGQTDMRPGFVTAAESASPRARWPLLGRYGEKPVSPSVGALKNPARISPTEAQAPWCAPPPSQAVYHSAI
jgi:hypothetical protein